MNEKLQRYPLAWPMNWKRTSASGRRRADFRRTVSDSRTVSVNGVNRIETTKRPAPVTIAHPDVGGRHDDMAKLTAARDFALKVLS